MITMKFLKQAAGSPDFWRWAFRIVVCALAGWCALQMERPTLLRLVPSLSPFVALLSLAAGVGGLFLIGAAGVAVASLFSPRLFCRWVCPTGTCRDAVSALAPRRWLWVARVPKLGVWLVAIGLGAALTGYPLFVWLDPLTMFNAFFLVFNREPGVWEWVAVAGLPVLLILSFAAPGLWCGRLCPLGALQDMLRALWRAIQARRATEPAVAGLGRRAFLGLSLGAGYRIALPPARGRAAQPVVIRPPASGSEARFTRLCARCGACARACPASILRVRGAGATWAGILAPEVSYEENYCQSDCLACGQSCPTGAIPRFTVANKFSRPMGLARVDFERCLISGRGECCGACVSVCPAGALDREWDPVRMLGRIRVKASACTGCGYCEYVCPCSPRAIRVFPLGTS